MFLSFLHVVDFGQSGVDHSAVALQSDFLCCSVASFAEAV